jgi:hypothetical protein
LHSRKIRRIRFAADVPDGEGTAGLQEDEQHGAWKNAATASLHGVDPDSVTSDHLSVTG